MCPIEIIKAVMTNRLQSLCLLALMLASCVPFNQPGAPPIQVTTIPETIGPVPASYPTTTSVTVVAPVQTDLEMHIIRQAASALCPTNSPSGIPTIAVNNTVFSFGCHVAAGHSIGARITRFANPSDAQAAFNYQDATPEFHGCLTFQAQFDDRPETAGLPMRRSNHSWLVDRWVIEVSTFDDTGIRLVSALTVSEQIYQAAIAYGLITGCD